VYPGNNAGNNQIYRSKAGGKMAPVRETASIIMERTSAARNTLALV
jgi:hypothetical protein